MATGHEHGSGSGVLGEVQLLLVGVDDLLEREILVVDVVGVDADDELAADSRCLEGAAADELPGRRGVESHVALRCVHRVGDPEPP